MEEYMKQEYDRGMATLVAGYPQRAPQFDLICHSMGAPISRIWECSYNAKLDHGDVRYYLSIAGIHGGNYGASRWEALAPLLKGGQAEAGCAVHRIRDYNDLYHSPHGTYLFAWGVHGVMSPGLAGHFLKFLFGELQPWDGVNNCPSATSQNGPYASYFLKSGPSYLGADQDLDLRTTQYGSHVRDRQPLMGVVDLALRTSAERKELGDHSFMDSGEGCMASYAAWLGYLPDPRIQDDPIKRKGIYQATKSFAVWPGDHQVPLPHPGAVALAGGASLPAEDTGTVLAGDARLEAPREALQYRVPIDHCSGATFMLLSDAPDDVHFHLQTPEGRSVDPATPESDPSVSYTASTGEDPRFRAQIYALEQPKPGPWNVLIEAPDAVPTRGITCWLDVTEQTDLLLLHQFAAREIRPGQPITARALVARGEQPLGTAPAVVAQIVKPNGETISVPLLDDGQHGDEAPGDGLLAAEFLETDDPGDYRVHLTAQGITELGNAFQRTSSVTFQVGSAKAALESLGSETATDEEGNGLYETLQLMARVIVREHGRFLLSAALRAPNRRDLGGALWQGPLEAGTREVPLVFDGRRIGDSSMDGPYVVTQVRLVEIVLRTAETSTNQWTDFLLCDALPTGQPTRRYRFWEFERSDYRPLLRLGLPQANGAFEVLLIGQRGIDYVVENSSDLRTWTESATLRATGAADVVLLAVPSLAGADFYRAASRAER